MDGMTGGTARMVRRSALPASHSSRMYRRKRRATLRPDRACGLDDQAELGALVRLAQWIAGNRAGEPALRADGEPVEIDIARGFLGAASEVVHPLQHRCTVADDT